MTELDIQIQRLRDAGLIVEVIQPLAQLEAGGWPIRKEDLDREYRLMRPLQAVCAPASVEKPQPRSGEGDKHAPDRACQPASLEASDAPTTLLSPYLGGWAFETNTGSGWIIEWLQKWFLTLEEAVDAVLDYYFGAKPARTFPLTLSWNGRRCAVCDQQVLWVSCGTPWEESEEFLSAAAFPEAQEFLEAGFLPTAVYCPRCGRIEENRDFSVRAVKRLELLEPGTLRSKVIVCLRQVLGIGLEQARSIADSGRTLLMESTDFEGLVKLESLHQKLQALGAICELRMFRQKSGSARIPFVEILAPESLTQER